MLPNYTVDFAILIEHLRRKFISSRSRSWGLQITSENTLSIITGQWKFISWNYLAKGQLIYTINYVASCTLQCIVYCFNLNTYNGLCYVQLACWVKSIISCELPTQVPSPEIVNTSIYLYSWSDEDSLRTSRSLE